MSPRREIGASTTEGRRSERSEGQRSIFTATISIDLPKKQRDSIYRSILPDLDSTPRATVKASNGKDELTISINAKDASALRASFNTMTRLLGVAKDALESE